MTNWATVFLPASAMPADFAGMDAVLGAGGIFRGTIDLEEFIDSFSIVARTFLVVCGINLRSAVYCLSWGQPIP